MNILTGTYYHNVDSKGRLNFPSKLRDILGAGFMATRGMGTKCITVYSMAEWEKLSEKVAALPVSKAGTIKRWLYSGACELVPDKQGRVLLPKELRDWCGIETEAVIIGTGDKAEIWSAEQWQAEFEEINPNELQAELESLDF